MKTFFLKFESEAQAIEALAAYHSEDQWQTASVDHALDIVGTIHKPTGTLLADDEGNSYPEMAPLDGFHVNLAIGRLPENLEPFVMVPKTPARVFA